MRRQAISGDAFVLEIPRNMMAVVFWLTLLLFLTFTSTSDARRKKKLSSCERLNIPLCSNLGYEWTVFPNPLTGIQTQNKTAKLTNLYPYLAQFNCTKTNPSPFVCSVYAPKCFPKTRNRVIPPCREFCQKAAGSCPELLKKLFDFPWPETLNCWNYPEAGRTRSCINDTSMNVVKPTQRRVKHKKSRGKKTSAINKLDKICCRFGQKAARKHFSCSLSDTISRTKKQIFFVERVLERCQDREDLFKSCCLKAGQKKNKHNGQSGEKKGTKLKGKNKHQKKQRKGQKKLKKMGKRLKKTNKKLKIGKSG